MDIKLYRLDEQLRGSKTIAGNDIDRFILDTVAKYFLLAIHSNLRLGQSPKKDKIETHGMDGTNNRLLMLFESLELVFENPKEAGTSIINIQFDMNKTFFNMYKFVTEGFLCLRYKILMESGHEVFFKLKTVGNIWEIESKHNFTIVPFEYEAVSCEHFHIYKAYLEYLNGTQYDLVFNNNFLQEVKNTIEKVVNR